MNQEIGLWPGIAPGSESATWRETTTTTDAGDLYVRNVVVPTLTPFLPDSAVANGTAVVVAPGGGFQILSWESEGTDVARWLASRGIAAFLLKYRLADTGANDAEFKQATAQWLARVMPDGKPRQIDARHLDSEIVPLAVADGKQAVRTVRTRAHEFGVHPAAVGFLGFSAGAFIATAVTLQDDPGCRPDFVATVYGGAPGAAVTAATPPLFSVVASDDPLCLDTCLDTFRAWRSAGRPAELHIYDQGGHGFGAKKLGLPAETWLDRLGDWMHAHGFLP